MPKSYRSWSPDQPYLLPPDPRAWLPDGHLAHFVLEVVEKLDISAIEGAIQAKDPRGERPYAPRMMLALLVYGSCLLRPVPGLRGRGFGLAGLRPPSATVGRSLGGPFPQMHRRVLVSRDRAQDPRGPRVPVPRREPASRLLDDLRVPPRPPRRDRRVVRSDRPDQPTRWAREARTRLVRRQQGPGERQQAQGDARQDDEVVRPRRRKPDGSPSGP
jgi:hypothetical protein